MNAFRTKILLLALGLAAAGQAQASSYLHFELGDTVAFPPNTNRGLGLSYDSRTGLTFNDTRPEAGAAGYSYSPHSAATGLVTESLTSELTGSHNSRAFTSTSASLVDGRIHAYAAGSADDGPFNGFAQVNTSMVDALHFTVLGGGPAIVTFTAHVDGSIVTDGSGYSSVSWADQVNIGDSAFNYRGGVDYGTYLYGDNSDSRTGWNSFTSSSLTNHGHDFTGTFTVSDGDTRNFYHRLLVECAGAVCDFSNTASIGLVLPDNVRLTSDSGVFLTDQAGGVPEPAAWDLMLTGFFGLGVALRNRRTSATATA